MLLVLPGREGEEKKKRKKRNLGPRVSHFGRTALKTLAILRTDEPNPIQSSYTTQEAVTCRDHMTSQQQPDLMDKPKYQERMNRPHTISTCAHTTSATLHCSMIPHSTVWYITTGLEKCSKWKHLKRSKDPCYMHLGMLLLFKCSMLRYGILCSYRPVLYTMVTSMRLHVPQNSPSTRTPKNQGAMHILCSIQGLLELSEC